MNFTITNSLAFISPAVVPFGLAYSLIKHSVDSYMLLNGTFKMSYLNVHFYSEVSHMMAFSTLIAQTVSTVSMLLSPDEAHLHFGSATTFGFAFTFISGFLLNQQVQSDWPIRVLPDEVSKPPEEPVEEPSYEPPLKMWVNSSEFY